MNHPSVIKNISKRFFIKLTFETLEGSTKSVSNYRQKYYKCPNLESRSI